MTGWRKALNCDANSCVQVATIPAVAVRDTKDNGTGPVLVFTREQWKAATDAIRAR